MSMITKIKLRTGAKSLEDVDIPDASWKPDFEVVDRYQKFSSELIRLALLGIGGYGFLIKWVSEDPTLRTILREVINYLMLGSAALAVSLTLLLAHRFFSTDCLFYQILIMRSLKRLNNPQWNENEKDNEKKILNGARNLQRKISRTSHYILIFSTIFFAIGFLFVIAVFNQFLHHVCNMPIK